MINSARPGYARYTKLDGIGHYPMEEVDDFGSLADQWLTELRSAEVLS